MTVRELATNPIDDSQLAELANDILSKAKNLGASAAEVSASVYDGFNATVRLGEVDTVEYNRDKGIGVTVYFGQRTGSASSSDTTSESIEKTVAAACNIAKYTNEDPYAGLADAQLMAHDYPELALYYPWDLPVDQAIAMAKECEALGMAHDKRIENAEGTTVATGRSYRVYANSHGFIGALASSRHSIASSLVAKEHGNMEADYGYTVARDANDLRSIEVVAEEAAKRTVRRLNAQKINTMEVPVIFEAPIAVGILGRFFGAIRGSSLYRNASFLVDHLDKMVFPEFLSIQEKPFVAKGLASSPFDGEGVKLNDRVIVEKGRLLSYILGSYSARKLGMKTTGNAGGTHNLYVTLSEQSLADLLKTMNKGILVTEVMGQGVNIVTGDYSQGASGFWVENGEIQYPIHEFTIASNLRDMYQNIVAIGNDVYPNSALSMGSMLVEKMMVAGQ